jgi:phosphoribosylformylglycinamidine synthase
MMPIFRTTLSGVRMKVLPGSNALSDFRLDQLLKKLRRITVNIVDITTCYRYILDLTKALSSDEASHLRDILIELGQTPVDIGSGELLVVAPRPGTISPWSSKATDILHVSGLTQIQRIERTIAYSLKLSMALTQAQRRRVEDILHDRMTEMVFDTLEDTFVLFNTAEPVALTEIDIHVNAGSGLKKANLALGLALSTDEIEYLAERYIALGRNPTDAELMMFAQANSEHCRHKIFNADWEIDGQARQETLFGMIRYTHEQNPDQVLVAYKDNSSVMRGRKAARFNPNPLNNVYGAVTESAHILMKVETHNHPTAISPFAGAATGSGGEIRDEGATGCGSRPKAGMCGFSVSNLKLPGRIRPWETDYGKPERIASALDIMLEGPIGAAAFNNEFGRPGLTGYFRTFEESVPAEKGAEIRGYHKPIMIAGGMGNIRETHLEKHPLPEMTPIVVLGGPAMLIGLGGGAASSMASGSSCENLDFASVQRGNPEMERRCQEVINACTTMGEKNPILSIHDVGAGGLSNAVPEIIDDAGCGGHFELRNIPNAEPGMSPMEIWCNEAQERYVLAISDEQLNMFEQLCERERCPYAVIGTVSEERRLTVSDRHFDNHPVDIPLEVLLGKTPKMLRRAHSHHFLKPEFNTTDIPIEEAIERVLFMPAVASKSFLITIGDRSVTGLVARDQMVGPWQVPVADVAVTLSDYQGYTGEAMAMGERAPMALVNAPASGRMAIGEALTNIMAAGISDLSTICLSANWMAPAGHPGEDANLFETVKAVGKELCPALGIAIPVGKDSLSMKTVWEEEGESREVTGPLSLIISAFASVDDVRKTLTPQLHLDQGDTDLLLVDLGQGKQRMGGSCLAQAYKQVGHQTPDLDDPEAFKAFFKTIQQLNERGVLLAYHDRSDGGLLTTICEMAFAGHTGLEIHLEALGKNAISALFNEELGAVIQVRHQDKEQVLAAFSETELEAHVHVIGRLLGDDRICIQSGRQILFSKKRQDLQTLWSETSYLMQNLRDNPECAEQEFERLQLDDPGQQPHVVFDMQENVEASPYLVTHKPRVAILREQGVNGHIEMAAAFDQAGFTAVDVHMTDVLSGRQDLKDFSGLIACGGFSYGDVLGAGGGWAKSILHNPQASDVFETFFHRPDVFALGVCNGCQMLSQLRDLIPGAEHWPWFRRNVSEQFEARLSIVEVLPSPSIFLQEMQGSHLPVAVAHGEGKAVFTGSSSESVQKAGLVSLRYVDNHGHATEHYPENPNGSPQGITGLTTKDGRFTIMMPHPERLFRTVQYSWHPRDWGENGPWMRMFRNARVWVG